MSNKKSMRNDMLRQDRNDGMTYRELGEKYGVSTQRARHICVRDCHDELFSVITDAASALKTGEYLPHRLYKTLARGGVVDLNGLLALDPQVFSKWRNVGKALVALFVKAQEVATEAELRNEKA